MINISELTDEDVRRKVIYHQKHGNRMHYEVGQLSSWNEHYIFVRFKGSVCGIACRPEDVSFVSEGTTNHHEMPNNLTIEDTYHELPQDTRIEGQDEY